MIRRFISRSRRGAGAEAPGSTAHGAWPTLILTGLLLGCGFRGAPAPAALSAWPDVFPLIPGTQWLYEVRNSAGEAAQWSVRVDGEVPVESPTAVGVLVRESGGIPGEPTFESSSDSVTYYRRNGFLFRSHGSARWRPMIDGADSSGDEPVLPDDPLTTRAWRGEYRLFDVGNRPMYELRTSSRLVSAEEAVEVPAGVFRRCLRVETSLSAKFHSAGATREIAYAYTDWYAPAVGLVQMRARVEAEGEMREVLTARLVSFRAGEPAE